MILTLFTFSVILAGIAALVFLLKVLVDNTLGADGRIGWFLASVFCGVLVYLLLIGGQAYFRAVPSEAAVQEVGNE